MTENINENTTAPDEDDVEGHRVHQAPVDERTKTGLVDDDVEGHAVRQAPADDVTDGGIDFERPR
jgi:hypothetical protein